MTDTQAPQSTSALLVQKRARTIHDVAASLGLDDWVTLEGEKILCWPPDVFALTALLLRDSGAYVEVVGACSCKSDHLAKTTWDWEDRISAHGAEWEKRGTPPESIVKLWASLVSHASKPVSGIVRDHEVWCTILELLAAADCASVGMGLPVAMSHGKRPEDDSLRVQANDMLFVQQDGRDRDEANARSIDHASTLCRRIHPSRAIVLPKMRTPQRGLTLRSMSHHLALYTDGSVIPSWIVTEEPVEPANANHRPTRPRRRVRNVLVLPYPHEIEALQFQPLEEHDAMVERFHPEHDLFGFEHRTIPGDFRGKLDGMIGNISQSIGPIHGVIMPEMAIEKGAFIRAFGERKDELRMPGKDVQFFVCGVYEKASKDKLAGNYVNIRCPVRYGKDRALVDYRQDKHHRWALDGPQLGTYGLQRTLHPDTTWWEGIELTPRELHFCLLDNHCVFSVLICEDLARPDPLGELIRAVGPNLVIALLMDGPQLPERWSSRYATALADDPGSSVLSVTSLGMSKLSRPAGKGPENSRIVALWRDRWTGTRALSLPEGSDALVVSLVESHEEELTADGRSDNSHAGCVKLGEVHACDWGGRVTRC